MGEQRNEVKKQEKKNQDMKKFILGNKLDYLQGKRAPVARLILIWRV